MDIQIRGEVPQKGCPVVSRSSAGTAGIPENCTLRWSGIGMGVEFEVDIDLLLVRLLVVERHRQVPTRHCRV